ncbi:MAG: 1-deoxy-D-xylulose-5-phosphate reductoisomerase [Mycoplasmatales bacterium]
MKKIGLLGASGSIGEQTIQVIRDNQADFELVAFSVGKNLETAIKIVEEFSTITYVCCQAQTDVVILETRLNSRFPKLKIGFGATGLSELVNISEIEIIVSAISGFAGIVPTIEAIKAQKTIALANKETLVVAGEIVMPLVKEYGVELLPVDSEHNAIFQALQGEDKAEINKLILTASGGSFRDLTREQLKDVTVEQALNHPNWSMGAHITIDSATMFNKGLEVIEAKHLFDVDFSQIEVLIHHESIIHSLVEFVDHSQIAQLSNPDMKLPIQYALSYPKRQKLFNTKPLKLAKIGSLTFKEVDFERYPALAMAFEVGKLGGSAPCVLNAAKETATQLFLDGKIKFSQIEEIVEAAIKDHELIKLPTVSDLIKLDQAIRKQIERRWS